MVLRSPGICTPMMALLALSITCNGCNQKPEDAPTLVYVLYDLSIRAPGGKDRYLAETKLIVDQLQPGDSICGEIITENTDLTASNPIDVVLPKKTWLDNSLAIDAKVKKSRQDVITKAGDLLKPDASNSDIMSGFRQAAKVLNGDRGNGYSRKYLIVFTDAIEQTPRLDFTRDSTLKGDNIQSIIKNEANGNRIPNLSGVNVFFSGVYSKPDPKADITPDKMSRIQAFWTAYCRESQTNLDSNHFAPSLINFKLH